MLDGGNNFNKKKSKEKAEELMKILDRERMEKEKIKVRSQGAWVDKLQILQEKELDVNHFFFI